MQSVFCWGSGGESRVWLFMVGFWVVGGEEGEKVNGKFLQRQNSDVCQKSRFPYEFCALFLFIKKLID